MSNQPVVITGMGMITPAGNSVSENWDNIIKGETKAALDPSLEDCPVKLSCRVNNIDELDMEVAKPWFWDDYAKFAQLATLEALRAAGLDHKNWEDPTRVAVLIGSGAGGTQTLEAQHRAMLEGDYEDLSPLTLPMGLLNMAAGQVAIEVNALGPCFSPCSACASGAMAIGLAKYLINNDIADVVIAGGAEAAITPFYVSSFAKMRTLSLNPDPATASRPFDKERNGFVIGEGAGVLILESQAHASKRNAPVAGHLLGYGFSADAHHVTTPHPEGEGAFLAMQAALKDGQCHPSDVGYVNAHGTSTKGNDVIESEAIKRLFGSQVPVSSTKGVTGHLLGAGGAIEAIYCLKGLQSGVIPASANLKELDPNINVNVIAGNSIEQQYRIALSNSFGFGGQNAALLLSN